MDILARALLVADRMVEDGKLQAAIDARYKGWTAGLGKDMAVPYPLFALAGLPAWQFFARVAQESGGSLLANQRLLSKVYFPRILAPVASAGAAFLDFAVCLGLLAVGLTVGGYMPGWQVLALPAFALLMVATALGVGCWLAALSTEFRDVVHVTPFLVQFWMIATPVVYPASLIPERFRWLAGLNPMTGVVEGFRWALLGAGEGPGLTVGLSVGVAALLLPLAGTALRRPAGRAVKLRLEPTGAPFVRLSQSGRFESNSTAYRIAGQSEFRLQGLSIGSCRVTLQPKVAGPPASA